MIHQTVDIAPLTTAQMARRCGADGWQLLATIRRGFLAEPARVGPFRVWRETDVDRVTAALRAAGYLPADEGT